MGTAPDGSTDRHKPSAAPWGEAVRKVRALERQRTEQSALAAGRSPRLETWLAEWLAATALQVRSSTLSGSIVDIHRHIIPTIGRHRLDTLEPEYPYAVLLANGLNAGTVHHARRALSKAPNGAVRRRRISRNPVALSHTPQYDPPDIEPLTVDGAPEPLLVALRATNM